MISFLKLQSLKERNINLQWVEQNANTLMKVFLIIRFFLDQSLIKLEIF